MSAQRPAVIPAGPSPAQRATVIFTALAANLVVAAAKLGASYLTGSSAMFAEALHSLADSTNEVLLLVGARRSAKPPDRDHPFGHARYRYLYAFLVSLIVFWVGGVLAVLEGLGSLRNPEPLVDARIAIAVLLVGAALDGWSLRTTIRAGSSAKGTRSWRRLLRETKVAEIIVVFLEDLGALIGLGIAAAGIVATVVTGNPVWDALASVAIGVLLMGIGLVVNRETRSLLLGESASPEVQAAIEAAITGTPGIAGIVELRTIHLSPDDLNVAARILVEPSEIAGITQAIVDAEARIRAAVPFRTVIYLEPRAAVTDAEAETDADVATDAAAATDADADNA